MDNIELDFFWFFVPNRLVWDNWKYFQGEHDAAGAQDTTYTVPVLASGWTVDHAVVTGHGLAAHMGLPDGLATATVPGINALPFRAYQLIINEWFKDQNLAADLTFNTDNTAESVGNYSIARVMRKHDYFTSALPYLQKGTAMTAAVVPLTDAGKEFPTFKSEDGGGTALAWNMAAVAVTDPTNIQAESNAGSGAFAVNEELWWDTPNLAVDINALRQSVAIQRLLERDARGGTRYVEIIKSHFGVTSPDYRLQRPEYLGGGKSFINISPVANTREVDAADSIGGGDVYQGSLAGVGTGVVTGNGFAKSFTEHGHVLGLMRARGDVTYFQGIDRMWSRSTRYDFYMPSLAHLGEMAILNKELWISNNATIDDAVFGYQERWAEYRTKMSRLAGYFSPDIASGALDHWHLAEDFASLPALNTTFIADHTPMERIKAFDTAHDFLLDVWFNYKCARPLPVYSIPSLSGRF